MLFRSYIVKFQFIVEMLKLYYDLLSQPSRALYIFVNKCKIPHQLCPVEIVEGE